MHLSLRAEWIGCWLVWSHKTRCWPPPPGIVQTFLTRWGQKGLHGDQSTPCKDIDALESLQRFATKICTKPWNMNYQYCLDKLRLQTLSMRRSYLKLCHLYKLVHGLSIFPNSPITTSSHSNHNPSLHVPSSHTNDITPSFVMPYIPGTHYLTMLCHYLAFI